MLPRWRHQHRPLYRICCVNCECEVLEYHNFRKWPPAYTQIRSTVEITRTFDPQALWSHSTDGSERVMFVDARCRPVGPRSTGSAHGAQPLHP